MQNTKLKQYPRQSETKSADSTMITVAAIFLYFACFFVVLACYRIGDLQVYGTFSSGDGCCSATSVSLLMFKNQITVKRHYLSIVMFYAIPFTETTTIVGNLMSGLHYVRKYAWVMRMSLRFISYINTIRS